MSLDLNVQNPISPNLQQVSAGGVNSLLYLSSERVQVTGGGKPPLFVKGAASNYGMLGLQGDGAPKDWQIQATTGEGSALKIAYSQNDPKLTLYQNGDLQVPGKITANGLNISGSLTLPGANLFMTDLPKLPPGVKSADVVVGTDGRLYRQDDPSLR